MSIGSNIRKRRYELKMSQQELANAMGYKTRSTIAKIESGENDVSQKKIIQFAKVLDTTVEELLLGKRNYTLPFSSEENVENNSTMKSNKNIVIVLAGGKSNKNSNNIPSQFINVNRKPILIYSIDAYEKHPLVDDIYIVCLKGWESIVKEYISQFELSKIKGIIIGANSGIASLKKAFESIKDRYHENDNIIVQESTRPLVNEDTITKLLNAIIEKNSAVIGHSMKDYVQFNLHNGKATYMDRHATIALQSPEIHKVSFMNHVFKKAENIGHHLNESCFTMLIYNLGYDINFIENNINNVKIARLEDIDTFKTLAK